MSGIRITGNTFSNQRPTGTNATGQSGGGPTGTAITIIENSHDIQIDANIFENNTTAINVTGGSYDILIFNNIITGCLDFAGLGTSPVARPSGNGHAIRTNTTGPGTIDIYNNDLLNSDDFLFVDNVIFTFHNNVIDDEAASVFVESGANTITADFNGWEGVTSSGASRWQQ